jgi:DNA-binding transcriptional ArsR family regulator
LVLKDEPRLPASLRETLAWARAAAGEQVPLPLSRLAALRGIAPRTLREHLARLEALGLVTRRYCGNAGISLTVSEDLAPRPAGEPDRMFTKVSAALPSPDDPLWPDASVWDNDAVRAKVGLLTRSGVYAQPARALARRPWITPELITAWVDELRRTEAVRNVAAVLVHTLEDPARCLPPPIAVAARAGDPPDCRPHRTSAARYDQAPKEQGTMRLDAPAEPDADRDHSVSDAIGGGGRALREPPTGGADMGIPPGQHSETRVERVQLSGAYRPVAPPGPPIRTRESDDAVALWEVVRQAMANRLPADVDTLWLKRAHPLGCSDGVLLVAVPTTLGADWLNLTGTPRCREAIQRSTGTALIVRFVPAGLHEPPSD